MGWGICVVNLAFDDDNSVAHRLGETYLYFSYNWSTYSDIWSVREHMLNRFGTDVAQNLETAIQKLRSQGAVDVQPDMSNPNWGWGQQHNPDWHKADDPYHMTRTIRLPPDQHRNVFLFHLLSFLETAKKYPNAYFIETTEWLDSVQHNGKTYTVKEKTTTADATRAVPWFRHPVHGTMAVDTFAKAMEVYGLARITGDSRAEAWWQHAQSLYAQQ